MCLLFDEIILKLLVKLRIFFEIRFKLSEIEITQKSPGGMKPLLPPVFEIKTIGSDVRLYYLPRCTVYLRSIV